MPKKSFLRRLPGVPARGWRLLLLMLLCGGEPAWAATWQVAAPSGGDDWAAISSVVAQASAGDTIQFQAGSYQISQRIAVSFTNLHLSGAGSSETILRPTASWQGSGAWGDSMVYFNQASESSLSGLRIDANQNAAIANGVVVENSSGLLVDRIDVRNLNATDGFGANNGVLFWDGVNNATVQNSTFASMKPGSEWGSGIRVRDSAGVATLGNTIDSGARGGIFYGGNSPDAVVRGNTITGTQQLSIELWGGNGGNVDRGLVENNRVDQWISLDTSNGSAVRNNVVGPANVPNWGLESINSSSVVWSGNVVSGEGGTHGVGMLLGGGSNVLVVGNSISGETASGMQIQGANRIYVAGNTLTGNGDANPGGADAAIHLNGDVTNAVFAGNTVDANRSGFNFKLSGDTLDGIEIIGNTITNNSDRALTSDTFNRSDPGGAQQYFAASGPGANLVSGNGADAHTMSTNPDAPFGTFTNQRPTIAPMASRSTVELGETVNFALNFSDADGTFGAAMWDFGFGLPSTASAPAVAFDRPGIFLVNVVAWDDLGRAASMGTLQITVVPEPAEYALLGVAMMVIALANFAAKRRPKTTRFRGTPDSR